MEMDLDIFKAYVKSRREFLLKIIAKFGFVEHVITLIREIINLIQLFLLKLIEAWVISSNIQGFYDKGTFCNHVYLL